jgi:hypothetical protein
MSPPERCWPIGEREAVMVSFQTMLVRGIEHHPQLFTTRYQQLGRVSIPKGAWRLLAEKDVFIYDWERPDLVASCRRLGT